MQVTRATRRRRDSPFPAPDGVDAVLGLAGGEVLEASASSHCAPVGVMAYPNGIDPGAQEAARGSRRRHTMACRA